MIKHVFGTIALASVLYILALAAFFFIGFAHGAKEDRDEQGRYSEKTDKP